MRRARLALFCVATVSTSGCYSERLPPPNFRYTCSQDADCEDPESCLRGLCQIPCTTSNFYEACPLGEYAACFNGVCASLCQLDDDTCPGGQTCFNLGLELEAESDPFATPEDRQQVGVCGDDCQVVGCPVDEVCVPVPDTGTNICLVACDPEIPVCPESYECQLGFCVPETSSSAPPSAPAGTDLQGGGK